MIGIYKITNLTNGKIYIGQSNDIYRRFQEHKIKGEKGRTAIDLAIQKYGADAFTYEVVEECTLDELNAREEYWINYYDSYHNGYNLSRGGGQQSVGENNGMAKLTEQDVIAIRKAYANHQRQREVYQLYSDKITFTSFQNVWQGKSWPHIMPEVFTEENKQYYVYQNSRGENGAFSKFTNEEVVALRTRYVNESAKQIYEDYKDRVSYQTLQAMLWGRSYKSLPIYKKAEKKWINI